VQAEKLVLEANSAALVTCALRPSGIFGPGKDKLLVPTVAARCRSGMMRFIIGDGTNIFDWTYVGNVAAAHVIAAAALEAGGAAAGQAFFITNDEPIGFWQMLGNIAEGLGYARPSIKLPVWLMMIFAYVALSLGNLLKFTSDLDPTRVRLSSVQRTVSCAKAKKVLGYVPRTSMTDGQALMLESFQHLRKPDSGKQKAS
jgi:nucleoside-diphosphate-sugar epimerase